MHATHPGSLQGDMDAVCDEHPYETRWHLRCLVTGREWGRGAKEVGASASTRKVSVMMAALAHCRRVGVSLDSPVTYTEELSAGVHSGTFRYMSPGMVFPLRDAIGQMIITSDNVCTRLVFNALGRTEAEAIQAVNDYCRNVGMTRTVHRHVFPDPTTLDWYHTDEGVTTTSPEDQTYLLTLLASGAEDRREAARIGLTQELCRFGTDLMRREYGKGMAALLPAGAEFGAKGGRGVRSRSHVGIGFLHGKAKYALAVYADWLPVTLLSGEPGYVSGLRTIARLNRIAYDYLVEAGGAS